MDPSPCGTQRSGLVRGSIAAVATGLAQGALDDAVAYATQRQAFGNAIIDHQGLGFLLADMQLPWRRRGRPTSTPGARRPVPYATEASVAKLVATDAVMKVTTDACEAQIQRMVFSRALARSAR